MNYNIDYTDQAFSSICFGDRRITSAYTPYGIQCIDSNFCARIINMNNKVHKVYQINRRPRLFKGKDGNMYESMNYDTFYDEVDLFNEQKGTFGVKVEWISKDNFIDSREFKHGDEIPKFNKKTMKEDKKTILKDIKNCVHLHKDIKDNLINNLNIISKCQY